MNKSKFSIPEEFKSQLCLVESQDTRSDAAILDSLTKYIPVSSEKNVWAFWDSGVDGMPGWCQRNTIAWIRLLGSSWTVRIVDAIPDSPNNALKWITPDLLPPAFVDGSMNGQWRGQHMSDLCRGALLYLYGGVWLDSGCILIRHLDKICWEQLEDPNSPYEVSVQLMYGEVIQNHFIASRKGNGFIKRWHDLFVYLWRDKSTSKNIAFEPLLAFSLMIPWKKIQDKHYNFNYIPDKIAQIEYFGHAFCWLRVCYLQDPNDGFNGPEYWTNKVLVFDARTESFPAEIEVGFAEKATFNIFSTRLDADPDSPEYQLAYRTTWKMLTQGSMEKVVRIKNLTTSKHLGTLWDMEENAGKDMAPGTFAELLRYGVIHFEQTREDLDRVDVPWPPVVIEKALLDPGVISQIMSFTLRFIPKALLELV